jgi:oligopeptide/dipeptide ABC transporter ATP-binding protein
VSQAVLSARDLSIEMARGGRTVRLVDDVTFDVRPGETLGIVGESGSGKSLTLRALLGILPEGAQVLGDVAFSAQGAGGTARAAMIFQEPMTALNPTMRAGDFIAEVLRSRGVHRRETAARVIELMTQVGISESERRARMWPHELSGGLRQRVMIAAALATDPDVLLCDEPTTALDVTIQAQVLDLLRRLSAERGMAIVFVSHDLAVVARMSDRIAVMYAGRIVEVGSAEAVLGNPRHPYTAALLRSTPAAVPAGEALYSIPGSPPDPKAYQSGCRFVPRCEFAREECAIRPHLLRAVDGSATACVRAEEVLGGAA